MPRRNNNQSKHTPFVFARNEGGKTRYRTKKEAESAAELRMIQHPELELTVYQALDGGWYLTRRIDESKR